MNRFTDVKTKICACRGLIWTFAIVTRGQDVESSSLRALYMNRFIDEVPQVCKASPRGKETMS